MTVPETIDNNWQNAETYFQSQKYHDTIRTLYSLHISDMTSVIKMALIFQQKYLLFSRF